MNKGPTLIELLVVIGVIVVLGVIIGNSFHFEPTKPAVIKPDPAPINLTVEKARAKKAIEEKAAYRKRYDEFEKFCGKGNVRTGIDYFDGEYGIFGCQDYSKVPTKNLN